MMLVRHIQSKELRGTRVYFVLLEAPYSLTFPMLSLTSSHCKQGVCFWHFSS